MLESLSIKLQAWSTAALLKNRPPGTGLSCKYHKMFEKSFLYGTPSVAASENGWRTSKNF